MMHLFKPAADVSSGSSYEPPRRGFATGSSAAPAAANRAMRSGQQFYYQQTIYHSNWNEGNYYGQQMYQGYYQEYECDQMYAEDSLSLVNVILDWEPSPQVDTLMTTVIQKVSSQPDTTSSSFPGYTDPEPPYTPPIDSWDRWDCTNEQLRDATRLLQLKDYLANPPAKEGALQAQSSAVTTASFDETQLEIEEEEEEDVEAEEKE